MKINGLESLFDLFENDNNYENFIKHFITNTLFFSTDVVNEQSIKLVDEINKNLDPEIDNYIKVPIRYSQKIDTNFTGIEVDKISNRKDARKTSKKVKGLIHEESGIEVIVDTSGNSAVVQTIKNHTGKYVSNGEKSHLINYIISHVWAKTDNPNFFTALWNIVIVPNYLNHILDKPALQHEVNTLIQGQIKAICLELYDIDNISNIHIDTKVHDDVDTEKALKEKAKVFIKNGLSYLDGDDLVYSGNRIEDYSGLTNREFILKHLGLLKKSDSNRNHEFLEVLLNHKLCKEVFKINFPILKEVAKDPSNKDQFFDGKGYSRYYKNDFWDYNNTKYIICNDWYPVRRVLFSDWVKKLQQNL